MASAREHLKSFHEKSATFHKSLGALHRKRAEALDGDDKDFHSGVADEHAKHAEFHDDCAKEMGKAVESELRKTQPSRASGIPASDAPGADNPHLDLGKRLVIKPGSRSDRDTIDPVLQSVLGSD